MAVKSVVTCSADSGSISICIFSASAKNCGSRTTFAKASRSIATRSTGTPGRTPNGLPIASGVPRMIINERPIPGGVRSWSTDSWSKPLTGLRPRTSGRTVPAAAPWPIGVASADHPSASPRSSASRYRHWPGNRRAV
jgi:hypothetical protein